MRKRKAETKRERERARATERDSGTVDALGDANNGLLMCWCGKCKDNFNGGSALLNKIDLLGRIRSPCYLLK